MRRGINATTVAAFATTLVVLGIVGWSAGWLVAGADARNREVATPSASATMASPTRLPSPAASARHSETPEPTPTRTDAFAMPDLLKKDFRVARLEAAAARLGVNIVFGETGADDGTVVRTNPESGIFVYPGLTVSLYVAGDAPKLNVPDVEGSSCREGRNALLKAGLLIEGYPSGEKGTVQKTEPAAGTEVAWNTRVRVFCAQSASPEGALG